MLRAALKSVTAHKIRLALTTIAVVLGVGFVAGTYLLTDTLDRSFTTLFGNVYRNVDVAVRGVAHLPGDTGGEAQRETVPDALLAKVRQVPGVAEVEGAVSGYAQLVDPVTRKPVSTTGAPTRGVAWHGGSSLSTSTIAAGRAPRSAGEVVVDKHTVTAHHWRIGQRVLVVTRSGVHDEQLVGTFELAGSDTLGGATITAFDPTTAQRYLGRAGRYDMLEIAATGTTPDQLRQRIAAVLPSGYEAITGKQLVDETSNDIERGIGFLNTALLVFAGIALFVGTFIIFNTFSMLVAQRTRELALYRALGASRGQVTRNVLTEATVTGVVASTIGLGFGFLVALALQAILGKLVGLPGGSLVLRPRTVVAAYAVGIVVTVVAAYFPARRASRIPPVAAMRDDVALPQRSLRFRALAGTALALLGAVLLVAGLAGVSSGAWLIGGGAAGVFLGVATLAPFISRPVVGALGAPLPRLFGLPGKLGRENALRSPRRTAATASALMIGVALVSAMATLGSSFVASTDRLVDKSVGADLIVTTVGNSGGQEGGLPLDVAPRIGAVPGVTDVVEVRGGSVSVAGKQTFVLGISPQGGPQSLALLAVSGDLNSIARGELAVGKDEADAHHWRVGQQVPVTFGRTGSGQLTIGAIYQKSQVAGGYVLGLGTFERRFGGTQLDQLLLVDVSHSADAAAVRRQVDAATASLPTVKVQDQSEYKASVRKQVSQFLNFIYALLAMSIIVAALGIVNTLALSVFERTRELGLLRAVGLSRRQLRRAIRLESTVIALFGALLGIALGLVFGWAMQRALADQGVEVLSFPIATLVTAFIAAGVVGVLAAAWPAFRAGRMNVLRAIATE
ncbi:MAG: ABC transporter permease [Frankiaceae bacterium]